MRPEQLRELHLLLEDCGGNAHARFKTIEMAAKRMEQGWGTPHDVLHLAEEGPDDGESGRQSPLDTGPPVEVHSHSHGHHVDGTSHDHPHDHTHDAEPGHDALVATLANGDGADDHAPHEHQHNHLNSGHHSHAHPHGHESPLHLAGHRPENLLPGGGTSGDAGQLSNAYAELSNAVGRQQGTAAARVRQDTARRTARMSTEDKLAAGLARQSAGTYLPGPGERGYGLANEDMPGVCGTADPMFGICTARYHSPDCDQTVLDSDGVLAFKELGVFRETVDELAAEMPGRRRVLDDPDDRYGGQLPEAFSRATTARARAIGKRLGLT